MKYPYFYKVEEKGVHRNDTFCKKHTKKGSEIALFVICNTHVKTWKINLVQNKYNSDLRVQDYWYIDSNALLCVISDNVHKPSVRSCNGKVIFSGKLMDGICFNIYF